MHEEKTTQKAKMNRKDKNYFAAKLGLEKDYWQRNVLFSVNNDILGYNHVCNDVYMMHGRHHML